MSSELKIGSGVAKFLGLPQETTPNTPFEMVKYLGNNCLTTFNETVGKKFSYPDLSPQACKTSCVLQMLSLGFLFSGNKMENIYNRLKHMVHFPLQVNIENTEVTIKIMNLFSGLVIRDLQGQTSPSEDHLDREELKLCLQYSQNQDLVNSFNVPSLEILNQMKAINYNFNQMTIDKLSDDIIDNSMKVNESTSMVYYVSMIGVHSTDNLPKLSTFHAFLVEQYFDSTTNRTCYRYYDSWIDKKSLEIKQFNYSGMSEFLLDLQIFCRPGNVEESKEAGLRCFGPSCDYKPMIHYFDPSTRILTGLSVRYIADEINPGDSVKNFLHLLAHPIEVHA